MRKIKLKINMVKEKVIAEIIEKNMLRMVEIIRITKVEANSNIRRGQIKNINPKNQKVDVTVMVAKSVEEINMIAVTIALATEGEVNTK